MTFSTAVYIEAPPALVFDALSNLEEAKEWMPNFVSIEMLTPGPVGAGTEWLQTRRTFGKQSTEHFRVTRWHPPSRLDIRGEGFLVPEALSRSATHTAYHVGQIVYVARHLASPNWKSLSIPKGKSAEAAVGDFKTRGIAR